MAVAGVMAVAAAAGVAGVTAAAAGALRAAPSGWATGVTAAAAVTVASPLLPAPPWSRVRIANRPVRTAGAAVTEAGAAWMPGRFVAAASGSACMQACAERRLGVHKRSFWKLCIFSERGTRRAAQARCTGGKRAALQESKHGDLEERAMHACMHHALPPPPSPMPCMMSNAARPAQRAGACARAHACMHAA